MSLEIILWVVAWVVLSETVFIIIYVMDNDDWIFKKLSSFLTSAAIIMIHLMIGIMGNYSQCDYMVETCNAIAYSAYLYELAIIAAIVILFGINKLIPVIIDKW